MRSVVWASHISLIPVVYFSFLYHTMMATTLPLVEFPSAKCSVPIFPKSVVVTLFEDTSHLEFSLKIFSHKKYSPFRRFLFWSFFLSLNPLADGVIYNNGGSICRGVINIWNLENIYICVYICQIQLYVNSYVNSISTSRNLIFGHHTKSVITKNKYYDILSNNMTLHFFQVDIPVHFNVNSTGLGIHQECIPHMISLKRHQHTIIISFWLTKIN